MSIFVLGQDGRSFRKLENVWDDGSGTVGGQLEVLLHLIERCLTDTEITLDSSPEITEMIEAAFRCIGAALDQVRSVRRRLSVVAG